MTSQQRRHRIIVLGGGFAGAYFAQAAERTLRGLDAEVVLFSRHNYFVFSPLLIEAGTGSLEPRHAVISIRSFLKHTRFLMADVRDVDTDARQVSYQPVGNEPIEHMGYDHLVLALGAVTRLPSDVPGLREYGHEMKNLGDAVALRDRVIHMLEAANICVNEQRRREMLHVVVVGGNFTGVEVAGEFGAFMAKASQSYDNVSVSDCKVTLVEIGDRILDELDRDLADYAMNAMKNRGIDVRLNDSIVKIEAERAVLNSGDVLPTRTIIWCAGIAPSRLQSQLKLPTDAHGYLRCGPDLLIEGFDNVWGIGDCAANIDERGKPHPPTAQHAIKEGEHLAHQLARLFRKEPLQPCIISSKGSLAAFGCRTGVAKVFGIKLSGFTAWFLWRTVYLLKMPGFSRRIRVALDWMIDFFFARDYVELGIHRRRG